MTPEQRLQWETLGYILLPDALTSEEVRRLDAAVDLAFEKARAEDRPEKRRIHSSPTEDATIGILDYDDIFLDLLEHPSTFPLLLEVLGPRIQLIDHDAHLKPPHTPSHTRWHSDMRRSGINAARSTIMVKTFFFLADVPEDGACFSVVPGSHHVSDTVPIPKLERQEEMPGLHKFVVKAGTALIWHLNLWHTALENRSDLPRRVIRYNYGHSWMRIWDGYEPSEALQAKATTPMRKQLLGMGPAYE